jgi:hypothetical protein
MEKVNGKTYLGAIFSLLTGSYIDDQHRHADGKLVSAENRRSMITNECNAHIFTSALMLSIAIPTVIDTPMSGVYELFDSNPLDSEGSYDTDRIKNMALVYSGFQLVSVVGFATSLCFAIMNSLFINIIPETLIQRFVQTSSYTFCLKVPLIAVLVSFFSWIISMGIFAHSAFGLRFAICNDVLSTSCVLFLFICFTVVVKQLSDITLERDAAMKEPSKTSQADDNNTPKATTKIKNDGLYLEMK